MRWRIVAMTTLATATLVACGSPEEEAVKSADGVASPAAGTTPRGEAVSETSSGTTTVVGELKPVQPAWESANGILTVGWLPDGYEETPIAMSVAPGTGPTPYGSELQRFGDIDKHEFITVGVNYGEGATAALDDPHRGLADVPGGYVARDDLLPRRTVYVSTFEDQIFMSWIAGPDLTMSVTGANVSESIMTRVAETVVVKVER